jgi:hypothetical protein
VSFKHLASEKVHTLLSIVVPPWSGDCGEPGALIEPLIHETRFGSVDAITDSYKSTSVQHGLEKRYLIHVASGPSLCNTEMDRNVASLEVPPRPWRVLQCPLVVLVCIESGMIVSPSVVASGHALRGINPSASEIVQVERQQVVCRR